MSTQIKLRRDTAANWTTANPILTNGEPGFETDTKKFKIGDGTSTWSNLSYVKVNYSDILNPPTIPSLTGYATEAFVSSAVNSVIGFTSAQLDTLGELAAALGNDPAFAQNITTIVNAKANTSSLAPVATSGSYNDLTNKPTIPTVPTVVSAFTNDAGYLTSYTETDPVFSAAPAAEITETQISNWDAAHGWGDHADAEYLTSYTETDPVFSAAPAATITTIDIAKWNATHDNFASITYVNDQVAALVDAAPTTLNTLNELAAALADDPNFATTLSNQIGLKANTADLGTAATTDATDYATAAQGTNADTAHGWGDHAAAGYALTTSIPDVSSFITASSLTGLATETYVTTAIGAIPPTDLTGYATETYVTTAIGAIPAGFSGSYNDLTDKPTIPADVSDLTDTQNLLGASGFSGSYNDLTDKPTIPDLTGYATETYVTTAISNIPPTDLTGYATETYVTTAIGGIVIPVVPTNVSEFTNDSGYITSSSLTGLATETYVTTAIGNIPPTDLTGYATETYVNTAVSNLVDTAPTTLDTLNELAAALGDDANFATSVSTSIGLKANTADLATVATSGSYNDLTDKPTIPDLTGYATETYVTTAISGVTATSLGLGNVTNESKATMFTDPTFTGTVSGVTSTMVGLGNVTNESKATMFTSPTFTGTVTLPIISEPLSALSSATGTVTHNLNTSSIFYHTSVSANFTSNFTNVPVTTNRVISATLIIEQGATAYIPNAVQIDGASTTIKWADGTVPTGSVNSVDVVAFSLINNNGTWSVIGALSKFA